MMAKEDSLIQEIRERLKELSANTAPSQVRDTMDKLSPLLAKLDEVKFERLWADLEERLSLKGRFYTALRRKIKETRKELQKSATVQGGGSDLSPEEELKALKPLAKPLIQCPDILGEVVRALNRLGLAGQEREAKIIYLALTSRIFERPVNVAVKGPSSGGKSFLVEQCLSLLPESAYYAISAMSEKSLAYSQEPMSHRHLVIYEASGLCEWKSNMVPVTAIQNGPTLVYCNTDRTSQSQAGASEPRAGGTPQMRAALGSPCL